MSKIFNLKVKAQTKVIMNLARVIIILLWHAQCAQLQPTNENEQQNECSVIQPVYQLLTKKIDELSAKMDSLSKYGELF